MKRKRRSWAFVSGGEFICVHIVYVRTLFHVGPRLRMRDDCIRSHAGERTGVTTLLEKPTSSEDDEADAAGRWNPGAVANNVTSRSLRRS
jgi:hypothetical protein